MSTFADLVDQLLRAIEKRRREDDQAMTAMRALIAGSSQPAPSGDKPVHLDTTERSLSVNSR